MMRMHLIFFFAVISLQNSAMEQADHSQSPIECQSVINCFWQKNNRYKMIAEIPQDTVQRINGMVITINNSNLQGKALKDYLLCKYPLTVSTAAALLKAADRLGFKGALQAGAYYWVQQNIPIDNPLQKEMDAMSKSVSSELWHQRYLLWRGRQRFLHLHEWEINNHPVYFSVRELIEHGHASCQEDNYTQFYSRLSSLDGLQLLDSSTPHICAEGGYITELKNEYFQKLTNLTKLSICDHRIRTIDPLLSFPRLERLYLRGNDLSEFPIKPGGIPWLTTLDLSNNCLTSLRSLSALTQLRDLRIYNNRITEIYPHEIRGLINLGSLYIGHNDSKKGALTNIEGLYLLTNLRTLEVSKALISITPAIYNLKNLRDLHFDENRLTSLGGLVGLPSLARLIVRHNNIMYILPEEVRALTKLQELYIGGNPLEEASLTRLQQAFDEKSKAGHYSTLNVNPYGGYLDFKTFRALKILKALEKDQKSYISRLPRELHREIWNFYHHGIAPKPTNIYPQIADQSHNLFLQRLLE